MWPLFFLSYRGSENFDQSNCDFRKFWPFDLRRLEVTWKLNNKSSKYFTAFEIRYLIGQNHDTICKIYTKVHKKSAWSRSVIRGYQILYEIAKNKGLTLVRLSLHCKSTQLQVIVTLFTVKSSQLQLMLTQHTTSQLS